MLRPSAFVIDVTEGALDGRLEQVLEAARELAGDARRALVHRALIAVSAAPAFMMGVVFCDRFGLDTAAFALTMSVGVIVYLALLPPLIAALPV